MNKCFKVFKFFYLSIKTFTLTLDVSLAIAVDMATLRSLGVHSSDGTALSSGLSVAKKLYVGHVNKTQYVKTWDKLEGGVMYSWDFENKQANLVNPVWDFTYDLTLRMLVSQEALAEHVGGIGAKEVSAEDNTWELVRHIGPLGDSNIAAWLRPWPRVFGKLLEHGEIRLNGQRFVTDSVKYIADSVLASKAEAEAFNQFGSSVLIPSGLTTGVGPTTYVPLNKNVTFKDADRPVGDTGANVPYKAGRVSDCSSFFENDYCLKDIKIYNEANKKLSQIEAIYEVREHFPLHPLLSDVTGQGVAGFLGVLQIGTSFRLSASKFANGDAFSPLIPIADTCLADTPSPLSPHLVSGSKFGSAGGVISSTTTITNVKLSVNTFEVANGLASAAVGAEMWPSRALVSFSNIARGSKINGYHSPEYWGTEAKRWSATVSFELGTMPELFLLYWDMNDQPNLDFEEGVSWAKRRNHHSNVCGSTVGFESIRCNKGGRAQSTLELANFGVRDIINMSYRNGYEGYRRNRRSYLLSRSARTQILDPGEEALGVNDSRGYANLVPVAIIDPVKDLGDMSVAMTDTVKNTSWTFEATTSEAQTDRGSHFITPPKLVVVASTRNVILNGDNQFKETAALFFTETMEDTYSALKMGSEPQVFN